MAHQGLNDKDFQEALRDVLLAICPELQYTAPRLQSLLSTGSFVESVQRRTEKSATKVLRVGFVSTFFVDHSIGRILVELLIYLNYQRVLRSDTEYALEVYVYTIDRRLPTDGEMYINGSDARFVPPEAGFTLYGDMITQALRQHLGDRSVRVPDNITTIRSVLSEARLDILIFTDVGMEFSTYQLAFSRFAPVQVHACFLNHVLFWLPVNLFCPLNENVLDTCVCLCRLRGGATRSPPRCRPLTTSCPWMTKCPPRRLTTPSSSCVCST
jgi:hypothetical protein